MDFKNSKVFGSRKILPVMVGNRRVIHNENKVTEGKDDSQS